MPMMTISEMIPHRNPRIHEDASLEQAAHPHQKPPGRDSSNCTLDVRLSSGCRVRTSPSLRAYAFGLLPLLGLLTFKVRKVRIRQIIKLRTLQIVPLAFTIIVIPLLKVREESVVDEVEVARHRHQLLCEEIEDCSMLLVEIRPSSAVVVILLLISVGHLQLMFIVIRILQLLLCIHLW